MNAVIAVLLLQLLIPAAEGVSMQYTVQMLPAKIALALPGFAATLPGGESAFASRDLAIGKDGPSRYRFGVADRRADPAMPLTGRFMQSVDGDGTLAAIDPPVSIAPTDLVVEGDVARAILVALAARSSSHDSVPLANIGWRFSEDSVTVMFVPARSEHEAAIIGGVTSLGVEKHYEVSRKDLKVIRTTLAR
jgi:hypothetical protein